MKNILFITWDGPQTSYMEGLFLPIFNEIQKTSNYKFHIIQFTWSNHQKIAIAQKKALEYGIVFTSQFIYRKPISVLGAVFTIFMGINFIKKYLKKNEIDIVMPRSTMPALMINRIKKQNFKLLFDADGLPLEERVDFSNLSKSSKQYRFLKKEETKILSDSDGVITRSKKAIAIHLQTLQLRNSKKFSTVLNGRDAVFFKNSTHSRDEVRKKLNIDPDSKVFVYCGSLGNQYGWKEMIKIFKGYFFINPNSKFLILTGNPKYAQLRIPVELLNYIIVLKIPFEEVPKYLSGADIAFAIREPKPSMQGVAPIKIGEYLLMGLPTIASEGIGDTEEILDNIPYTSTFNHQDYEKIEKSVLFVENLKNSNYDEIRRFALDYFSIEKSAESYINALNKL